MDYSLDRQLKWCWLMQQPEYEPGAEVYETFPYHAMWLG
jgi:hypothetical protein